MKTWNRIGTALALAALASLPAAAQDRGAVATAARTTVVVGPVRDGDPLRDFLHCLRVLDLSDPQKTAIDQFLEAEKPTLQTLRDTLEADRQTLRTDAGASPPDPCKIGNDVLKVRADRQAIVAEIGKIKAFIESQLTDAQKLRFDGCMKGSTTPMSGSQ